MAQTQSIVNSTLKKFSKIGLYGKKLLQRLRQSVKVFILVYRHGLYKDPNNPVNTRYVQYFCRRLCKFLI
jgi:1-acyl-sn-glycerol-3-phosphate acyltransferase